MIVARHGFPRLFCKNLLSRRQQSVRFLNDAAATSTTISSVLLGRARSVRAEHAELSRQLNQNYDVNIAKKVGDLSPTSTVLDEWEKTNNSLTELQSLLSDPTTDPDLRTLALDELAPTTTHFNSLTIALKASLAPPHPFAHLPCLLELRPGVGGSEAALFVGDLLRMYQAFCKRHSLRTTLLKYDAAEAMGSESMVSEAVLEIENEGAYGLLRCEAGVHRVQRVPATETKGRTHTSAVGVLVLPNFPTYSGVEGEAGSNDPESDYYVNVKDVRTDVMRASGAGGQHVNTTDSAVRLTHLPTGTVVLIQESRSQLKNREMAWSLLRGRLAQARREKREEERAALRASVLGVSKMGRGDKVRTYNWGQQRCTDHRCGVTVHNLDEVLAGGEALEVVMRGVRTWLMEREVEGLVADEVVRTKGVEKVGS